jgi:transketolase
MDLVVEAASTRPELVVLTGDAGLGVLDLLQADLPASCLNLGVAEQNMASFAAGLALAGDKVFLYNIIPFLLYRCYEQVRNDLCGQELPVVLVGIGSGVTYAPAGMSHYAIEDLGLAATLPNLTVLSPCDVHEARAAAVFALDAPGPVYVRLAKRGGFEAHAEAPGRITAPLRVREGRDCAILFHGSIAEEAFDAAARLGQAGIAAALVSVPCLQPLDEGALLEMLAGVPRVVTVEEHRVGTGLGGMLERLKARRDPGWKLLTRGIPDRYLRGIHDTAGMRRSFRLTGDLLAEDVARWCAGEAVGG